MVIDREHPSKAYNFTATTFTPTTPHPASSGPSSSEPPVTPPPPPPTRVRLLFGALEIPHATAAALHLTPGASVKARIIPGKKGAQVVRVRVLWKGKTQEEPQSLATSFLSLLVSVAHAQDDNLEPGEWFIAGGANRHRSGISGTI